jgi:hypothetical protein
MQMQYEFLMRFELAPNMKSFLLKQQLEFHMVKITFKLEVFMFGTNQRFGVFWLTGKIACYVDVPLCI